MFQSRRQWMFFHLISSGLLIVSFQNCAGQYGVETSLSSEAPLSKATAVGVVDPDNVPDIPVTDPNQNNGGSNPGGMGSTAGDDMVGDCKEDENQITAEEAVQYCQMRGQDKKAKNMSSISNIADLRGMISYQIDSLSFVQNVHGKLRLQGLKEDSAITLVENVRGLLILCDVSVKEMKGGNGNVILVNSQIEHLQDHQGSIKVVQGSVGEVVNHRGNIKYLDQVQTAQNQ